VIVDIKAWRLNFRTIEPVLHPSRWVEAVEAVAERPIQVYLHWKEALLVIVDIKAWRLNFGTIEPVLHSSRWVEEEKLLPLSIVSATLHLLPKAERIHLDQVSAVEFLNFASFDRSCIQVTQWKQWKRPIQAYFQ